MLVREKRSFLQLGSQDHTLSAITCYDGAMLFFFLLH